MTNNISRENALEILKKHIKNQNMFRHCLASEAVMRALAEKFGEDPNKWGLAGLLHDIDLEIVNGDMYRHGIEAEKVLKEYNLDSDVIEAIKLHNEAACSIPRSTKFHHALAAGETITGLITATTLVYPDKKLSSVKTKSVVKRMKEKAFAASVNRDTIMECEKIGMTIDEFAELSINAMKLISDELGL